jgi:ribonuclease Z
MEVTILGVSSASPAYGRNPTAQVVNVQDELILLDCGEGTQMQLRRYKQRFAKLNTILISHLHGDHFFGLPGLLSSFHLLGRRNPVNIYGPPGLKPILELLFGASDTSLGFPLHLHAIADDFSGELLRNKRFVVEAYPLSHSQPCHGFVIRQAQPLLNINKAAVASFQIPTCDFLKIKQGHDWVSPEGVVVPVEALTLSPQPVVSYGFFTDTRPISDLGAKTGPLTCMYHEATFGHDLLERAVATKHSTAREAALMARSWGAGTLILGHFSARYADLQPLLEEARASFPESYLAEEGLTLQLRPSATQLIPWGTPPA